MNRLDFIKQTSWVAVGGLLIPSVLLSACRKEDLFEDSTFKGKVLIVGAGAAGLYAGYLLKSKGIDFQILEASSIHGGRLGKLTGFADYPLDLGAQWLHGNNSIVGDLVTQSKTKITLDDSAEFYYYNQRIVSELPQNIQALFTREENVPDVSFKDFATQEGFGADYANIVEGIAGDSGAAASRISAYYKVKEEENWASGDNDYKFEQTYFDVIDSQIAAAVKDKIVFDAPVTKVDYTQDTLAVTDANGTVYTGDKVILTVPITMLKANTIQFTPALPESKTSAFGKIGMDAGMKVFLKFSSPFYRENLIGGPVCGSYADEHVGKKGSDHVLLAFIMGAQAEYLTALGSDAAITGALLAELDTMYGGQATSSFIASHVQNWTTHPYIRGAYSYSTVGMGDARSVAAQSVNGKLFFAGEAMNTNGHHQTVHGAVETGYREVINIFKSLAK